MAKPPTGKAKAPHNTKRPERKGVMEALAQGDLEMMELRLTARQRSFAHEYIVDFDATAAAIRAGYAVRYANRQGFQLVHHKGIAALITHLNKSKEAKLVSISPEYVLQKVTEIVTRVDAKDGDKLRGLELIARHLGMFIERTELTGKDGAAIEVNQRKIEEEASSFTDLLKGLKERADEKTTVN
jgi:phage terminase small subunit